MLTALSAMAHETRLEIVRLLVPCKGDGLPAGVLADRLGVSPSGLTFHLNALEQAGLVSSQRKGRQVIYSTRTDTLGGVIGYLLNDCCGRDPEVCAKSEMTDFVLP
ncbi:ArsR/SmtB family transcription factor [Aliiroseovarius subalbicans]|uniref:ArsR/SmtB family transcription factor n=1 Tax=Aliiroseovarius subalbicans TaxID=2925840 RepID=UPI001F563BFE